MSRSSNFATGQVAGIIANLVIVRYEGAVAQNEVCYIQHENVRLMAEVIKVKGDRAYVQVFESTRGLRVGLPVEFTGHMLEATLGPGVLSCNYDGLMHNLNTMTGIFLRRGDYTSSLSAEKTWDFKPIASPGEQVSAGDWLGEVPENAVPHRIMVPFTMEGKYTVKWIAEADDHGINDTIAILTDANGREYNITMVQRWPIKRAIKAYREKPRPFKLLETGVRTIDTLNPIVEGGTGFVPGPFGSGKTVLQQAMSKQAEADVVIVAACGERANEVVDLFVEFPELDDPWTGRKLMERTVIIANTSNMPVAAREASVYTAMTIAEYYRAMGLKVLMLADSTSRWAQALREVSGRLEEIPGEEAFPAYLESVIAAFYERGGVVKLRDGSMGSVTIGGSVSPAGGNFEEPVTQSTLKVVGAFHGLSRERSDARRFPAIQPLESWSKYGGIVPEEQVAFARGMLRRGNEVNQMMKVVGEEGTSMVDFVTYLKGEYLDAVYLQQDAYHEVDAATSAERQQYVFAYIYKILQTATRFTEKEAARQFFQRLTQVTKDWNRVNQGTPEFRELEQRITAMITEVTAHA